MFEERFGQLPAVLQNAIRNADVEKKLREMARTHNLHVDQWDLLENEVKLALYGFEDVQNLAKNIQSEVGLDETAAAALAQDISVAIFEPIREELERSLSHPEAKAENVDAMETMRREAIAAAGENLPAAPAVQPATPPAPAPAEKAVREPLSGSYRAAQPSSARTTIEGDPYREPAV